MTNENTKRDEALTVGTLLHVGRLGLCKVVSVSVPADAEGAFRVGVVRWVKTRQTWTKATTGLALTPERAAEMMAAGAGGAVPE